MEFVFIAAFQTVSVYISLPRGRTGENEKPSQRNGRFAIAPRAEASHEGTYLKGGLAGRLSAFRGSTGGMLLYNRFGRIWCVDTACLYVALGSS